MAESAEGEGVEAIVEETVDETAALAEFTSGFEDPTATPTEVATLTPEEPVESAPDETGVSEVVATVTPELTPATVTQEQLNTLLNKARTVDELTATVAKFKDDTAGRIGGMEQTIKKLIESTPAGEPVEVTADDLVEFTKEFPDLAPKLAKDLTAVLAKKGLTRQGVTPAADLTPAIDVNQVVDAKVATASVLIQQQMAEEHLASLYGENWREITGAKDSQTPYRLWLNTQPQAYRDKILTANSGVPIAESIAKFQKYDAAEAAKRKPVVRTPSTRTARLSEAVPPKGGAPVSQPQGKTALDEFHEGYNS